MESNEQLAFEELRWFDKYVKGEAPTEQKAEGVAPGHSAGATQ
jgi:hypothetical protein